MSGDAVGAVAAAAAAFCAAALPLAAAVPAVRVAHPERDALHLAGWRWSLVRWEALRAAVALGAASVAAFTFVPVAVGIAAGAALPSVMLQVRAGASRERARRATTRMVATFHGALASGSPMVESLRRAADASADVIARAPFDSALASFAAGAALDDALLDAGSRCDRRSRMAIETIAVGVSERLSLSSFASLVGAVADRLAFEDALADEVRARTGGARAQVALLACVVPLLTLYLAATMPSLADTLASPLGRTLLVPAAAVLEVTGIVLGRRAVAAAT